MDGPNKNSAPARKPLALMALVVMLCALGWHVITENSAERDWNAYKLAAEQRGETLEWAKVVPSVPPESQNFYGAAIVAKWMPPKGAPAGNSSSGPTIVKASGGDSAAPAPTEESRAMSPHLPAGFPPPTIQMLKALPRSGGGSMSLDGLHRWLEQWNDEFVEFRAAGKRKYVYLYGDYSFAPSVPIQDFVAARTLAHTIAAKAKVNLLLGQPEAARDDLESLETVMRGFETEPRTLVAAMIRVAVAGLYVEVVREGLTERCWKPDQLGTIQSYLEKLDLLTHTARALTVGERVGLAQILDAAATGQGGDPNQWFREDSKIRAAIMAAYPKSWIRRNQLFIAGIYDESIAALDPKSRRYHPKRATDLIKRVQTETEGFVPNKMFAAMAIPNFTKAFESTARNQTGVDLAAVACALERCKVARGDYPQNLTSLTPEFLANIPRDLVSGAPVIYRKSGDSYLLYSVGPDGRDDGGASSKTDWPWVSAD